MKGIEVITKSNEKPTDPPGIQPGTITLDYYHLNWAAQELKLPLTRSYIVSLSPLSVIKLSLLLKNITECSR